MKDTAVSRGSAALNPDAFASSPRGCAPHLPQAGEERRGGRAALLLPGPYHGVLAVKPCALCAAPVRCRPGGRLLNL